MISDNDSIKMIFGFKVKYLRQQKELSYKLLAERTGLSTSYLHDIEKGRKYPKVDKITALAEALGVTYDFLVSTRASKKLQPVVDLLTSDFIKEFPLDFFGISPEKLFELFSNTPDKVNAFIRTIFKITRNYQMQREHIYLAALRSYQDMFDNYFVDIEEEVHRFRKTYAIAVDQSNNPVFFEQLLQSAFGIAVDRTTLPRHPELQHRRSYFSPERQTLFINMGLSDAQENFLLGRELAFQFMKLSPRPYLTRIADASQFDKLLNNFKASYFSVALLMEEYRLADDFRQIATQSTWNPELFSSLLRVYCVTPEMLLQRLTNILPHHFGIKDLFFIRLAGEERLQHFRMTKELHLSQLHNPYANESNEHYCRRWVSVNIIKNLQAKQREQQQLLVDGQISTYYGTNNAYFCLSMAKINANTPASVTIGLLINDQLRQQLRFLSDASLSQRLVNTTCERCAIADCEARAALPTIIRRQEQQEWEAEAIKKINAGTG